MGILELCVFIYNCLEKFLLHENCEAYFTEANKMRVLGKWQCACIILWPPTQGECFLRSVTPSPRGFLTASGQDYSILSRPLALVTEDLSSLTPYLQRSYGVSLGIVNFLTILYSLDMLSRLMTSSTLSPVQSVDVLAKPSIGRRIC